MKIAVAQYHFRPNNFSENFKKIKSAIAEAKEQKASCVVFPAFAISGFPPHDLLLYAGFIKKWQQQIDKILKISNGISIVIDSVFQEDEKLFHRIVLIKDGKIQAFRDDEHPADTAFFKKTNYFVKGNSGSVFVIENTEVRVCFEHELNYFSTSGSDVECCIVLQNKPFEYDVFEKQEQSFCEFAKKNRIKTIVVNPVGGETSLVFSGASFAIDAQGQITEQAPFFKEELWVFDSSNPNATGWLRTCGDRHDEISNSKSEIALVHDALVLGIKDYFKNANLKTATLGLSGGIDSAVVLPLAVEALGRQNVSVLLMPSQFSSDHSVTDAIRLAENLRVQWHVVPIKDIYHSYQKEMHAIFGDLPFGLAEENLQARIRGSFLMTYANKFGHVLLNTSNKSESAVGYGTMYGDLCGGLAVIADLYKTQVYDLARYINRKKEIIPENIITKAPSAELRPDQKDSDSLPDYDTLDKILYAHLELKQDEKQLVKSGFDATVVERTLRLLRNSEFKRKQTAPAIKVSSCTFGIDRVMPL